MFSRERIRQETYRTRSSNAAHPCSEISAQGVERSGMSHIVHCSNENEIEVGIIVRKYMLNLLQAVTHDLANTALFKGSDNTCQLDML